jgi:hypothetical protein
MILIKSKGFLQTMQDSQNFPCTKSCYLTRVTHMQQTQYYTCVTIFYAMPTLASFKKNISCHRRSIAADFYGYNFPRSIAADFNGYNFPVSTSMLPTVTLSRNIRIHFCSQKRRLSNEKYFKLGHDLYIGTHLASYVCIRGQYYNHVFR